MFTMPILVLDSLGKCFTPEDVEKELAGFGLDITDKRECLKILYNFMGIRETYSFGKLTLDEDYNVTIEQLILNNKEREEAK
ncbi:MAG: hypothetical protein FWH05_04275 [Oscillospiraceae bacterium]|nr:hypothetical protein [Oscillospiraceae bacterium]